MKRYKIQKGNIHSYKFAMDAAALFNRFCESM